MTDLAIPADDLDGYLRPLLGLPVSLPWQGVGSAIFLELGALSPPREGLKMEKGEGGIGVEWDWRLEVGPRVAFGSSCSRPKILRGIEGLRGTKVAEISVFGAIPELEVRFSDRSVLRTTVMVDGDPEWSLRLPRGEYVYARDGRLFVGTGDSGRARDEASLDDGKTTARRWGQPVMEPRAGSCKDCRSFVPLDGEGYLIEYGACTSPEGPFDGRIVKHSSGCPSFAPS